MAALSTQAPYSSWGEGGVGGGGSGGMGGGLEGGLSW